MTKSLVTATARCATAALVVAMYVRAKGETAEPLRLAVPVYGEITTDIHRPENLKPGEKCPAVLLIGPTDCKLAKDLSTAQRIVCVHYSPMANIPAKFRGWEDAFGHAGQDAIALLLRHLLAQPEVDKRNTGLATFSFGVVGATGALARHRDLDVKFLVDWEGPSGPQNLLWVKPDFKTSREHPAADKQFWQERTAADFMKRIRCRYLRIQAQTDHVQTLGKNQHAIEMLNNATKGECPWTRCNNNAPNTLYDEVRPENEQKKWLPGATSLVEAEKMVSQYVAEMIRMPPLSTSPSKK